MPELPTRCSLMSFFLEEELLQLCVRLLSCPAVQTQLPHHALHHCTVNTVPHNSSNDFTHKNPLDIVYQADQLDPK